MIDRTRARRLSRGLWVVVGAGLAVAAMLVPPALARPGAPTYRGYTSRYYAVTLSAKIEGIWYRRSTAEYEPKLGQICFVTRTADGNRTGTLHMYHSVPVELQNVWGPWRIIGPQIDSPVRWTAAANGVLDDSVSQNCSPPTVPVPTSDCVPKTDRGDTFNFEYSGGIMRAGYAGLPDGQLFNPQKCDWEVGPPLSQLWQLQMKWRPRGLLALRDGDSLTLPLHGGNMTSDCTQSHCNKFSWAATITFDFTRITQKQFYRMGGKDWAWSLVSH